MSETDGDPSLPAAGADERSRRQLLRGGALLGAGALVAGCTSKVSQPPSSFVFTARSPGAKQDVEILNGLLDLEYQSIAAYTACIQLLPQPMPPAKPKSSASSPAPAKPAPPKNAPPPPLTLLVPLAYAAAQQFLTQELSHVRELQSFITNANGKPMPAAAFYKLGHPHTKEQALHLLHQTEGLLLKHYLQATKTLTVAGLRGAAAAIMGNHAQHSLVLRLELGLPPIPSAFLSTAT